MKRITSIRRRMIGMVVVGVLAATALQAVMAYRTALREVATISDYHMVEMARAVRRGMPTSSTLVVPAPPIVNVRPSEDNSFILRVKRFGNPKPDEMHQRSQRHFSTRHQGLQTFRVLYMEAPGLYIEVSHDLAIRARTARQLAIRTVMPVLWVAPFLLLAIWLGVGRALAPMRRTRLEVAARAGDDLKPLDTTGVPEEALPFVQEINVLFRRIEDEFEARRAFVADVAHELRSPLTALSLQVQGLRRAQTDEAREIAHARLTAGIARANRLVEQLLVLARESAAEPVAASSSLGVACRLALADAVTLAQARNIDLGAELPDKLPDAALTVSGDPESLRTLLRNLLDNAVKYTPEGGVVNLALQVRDDGLVVTVDDSGPGIAEQERAGIFDRFRRGQSGHNTGGSGLGLAIVHAITTRLGAAITLERSASLGGLRVTLRFAPPPPAA